MPHQCVRCSELYEDGASVILQGCPCGGKLFFYIRKEKLETVKKEVTESLSPEQREQVESDIYSIIGTDKDDPVVLDIEAVRVVAPGKYELDLVHLFKGEPIIFKMEEGKYIIDIPETFRRLAKKQ